MDQINHLTVGDALVILGAVTGVGVAARKLWPRARDFVLFLTDVMGTPERNGQPAKPGLMERVAELAAAQEKSSERLTRVEETASAAASAADAATKEATRVSDQVSELDRKVDGVAARQDAAAAEQTQIRAVVEELRLGQATDGTDNSEGRS